MEERQTCFREMVNEFCGYAIDVNLFSTMLASSLIMGSLSYIYDLYRNRRLSSNDHQEIKKIFHDNFIFFSEENNKQTEKEDYKTLFLLCFLVALSLIFGSFYLPLIFIPLTCCFLTSWLVSYCIMKKKNDLLNLEKTKLPDELFRLKYELNGLKNTLVDSYATETDNHAGNQDSVTPYSIENTSCPKKGVTFSLITKINLFSENFGSSLSLDIEERGVVPQL